ncbi:MAG: hypothetical protein MHMPM18_001783 [Marteilia pararefringens]
MQSIAPLCSSRRATNSKLQSPRTMAAAATPNNPDVSAAASFDSFRFDASILTHEVALELLKNESTTSVEELRELESEYRAGDSRSLSLICLLILSRKIPFDEALIDALRVVVQSEIKQPRDAHHEFKDDFSKRFDSEHPMVGKLMNQLHAEIRTNFKAIALPIIETCNNLLSYPEINSDPEVRHPISKIRADVCRYSYEVLQDQIYRDFAIEANKRSWEDISKTNPPYSDIHFLGVVLNHSVFIYNVLCDTDKAIEFASLHFEKAKLEFPSYSEKQPKEDGARIVKLLEENIMAWSLEAKEAAEVAPAP